MLIAIMAFAVNAQAQNGYKLDFKISGLPDTTFYLGNFFGESTYVKDTARSDKNGSFTFDGKKPLDEGVYFIVLNKSRLFDILISKDQQFSMSTSHPQYVANMKITGSEENELFFEHLMFNSSMNTEAEPYVKLMRDSTSTKDAQKQARAELDKLNEKVMSYQDKIIDENPETLLTKILKANKRIDIPDAPTLENGRTDSTFSYRYYKTHYWDNFDLSDPAMIRLSEPLYKKKVEDYLDRLILQHPDSITNAINRMAEVAKTNSDTYKYLVWIATLKYQNPEIMGLDEVFVNIYDNYYANGEMDFWANDQLKSNLKERADQLRLSLLGSTAPNLIMQDEDLRSQALYDLKNKYTIIYFYDPDCGHCKKETPKLKKFTEDTSLDIGVFAVSADTSMAKMRTYIKDMGLEPWTTVNGPRTYTKHYQKLYDAFTTPTIYVLDEKKKIIGKKIPAERLQDFLSRYEEAQKSQLKEE